MKPSEIPDSSPIKRAFEQLGGLTPTARAISKASGVYVTSTTAHSWLRRNRIPPKYLYAFTQVTDIPAEEFLKHAAEELKDED